MKHFAPFILFIFAFSIAYSQNNPLELTFTGKEETTFSHVSTDSVYIRNITKDVDTMITGNDTTLLLNLISNINEISETNKPFKLQQNYPNPFRDHTTFAINVFQKENLEITLFDIYGQNLTELNEAYETGTHLFTISGNQCQFYILNVTSKSHSSSIKLTNNHPSGNFNHSIIYTGNQPIDVFYKVVMLEEGLPYESGDELLFIGYADGYEFSVQYDSPENSTDYTFQFDFINTFECGDPFTDNRDGQVYETKKIDRQCWMTENLKIGEMIQGNEDQLDNEEFEKYCYNNNADNCENYGGLYQWDEMMQYDTARFTQGICPQGWHLPTIDEWNTLIDYYGGPAIAGDSLKFGGNSGFNALMAGSRNLNGNFGMLDNEAYFWTSINNENNLSYYNSMTQSGGGVSLSYIEKQNAYSVRCLKGLPVALNSNAITIDSTVYVLISDSLELTQGIYKYEYNYKAKAKDLVTGNVIVGITGDGYLRKINAVSDNPPILTLETSQATLEDVFIQGDISFDFNLDDLQKNNSAGNTSDVKFLADGVDLKILDGGFEYTFDDVDIYNNGNLSLKITNGTVEFDPNFKFDFQYTSGVIKKLDFYADKSILKNSIDIELMCQVSGQFDNELTLASYEKSKLIWIGWLPVLVKTTLDLKAVSNINIDAATSLTSGYTNENSISIGTKYENGQWSDIWDLEQENTFHPIDFAWSVNLDQKLALIPEVTMEFYKVAGPYFNIDLYEQMQFNHVLPSHDIDANFSVGLDANVGANVTIFGKTLASYNKFIPGFNFAIWNLPDELQMISGNNQSGPLNQQLTEPIKVKVVDNYGNTFSNIPVHFEITEGGGTLSEGDVMTNSNGYAQTYWTIGADPGENKLSATVVKADGTQVSGSPLLFTAIAGDIPTVSTSPVTSITLTSATCGGNVTDGGGYPITERGVCWNSFGYPTINNDHTSDGTGTGIFISNITGLEPLTTYYIRAYATNDQGTAYGEEIEFTTIAGLPIVFTDTITEIEYTTALSGGTITSDGGSWVLSRGVCWSTSQNPTIADDHTLNGTGTMPFTSYLSGLEPATLYYVRAYATNNDGTAYGEEKYFISEEAGLPCPDTPTVTDADGNVYNTVQIYDQCWMKENLRVGTMIDSSDMMTDNDIIEKWCVGNNCSTYGGLYHWSEAMQYITTEGTQGICPDGWHIPSNDDWEILENTADYPAGIDLKSISGWSNNGNGNDLYGFTGLPAGFRWSQGTFLNVGDETDFWTSTETLNATYKAVARGLEHYSWHLGMYDKNIGNGFSVRCLKD